MLVQIETEIDAPARHVWGILAHRFAGIDVWSGTVETSREMEASEIPPAVTAAPRAPVAGRVTKSAFIVAYEVLTNFDDPAMTFTFDTVRLPLMLQKAENTTRVEPTGPRTCRVVFDVTLEMWGPFALGEGWLKGRFTKAMDAVHGDLKRHAEETRPQLSAAI